ncbi:hypothetical protein [Burkholderia diffusa]|uniref:hypothetical protein n=1 Tax=Burkholderia diffusa TaxID=488732 RepID=UPI000B13E97A|nr:hypothetical protein [Burkholderia diffusa]
MVNVKRFVLRVRVRTGGVIAAGAGLFLALSLPAPTHAGQPVTEVKQVVVQTDGNSCPIRMTDPYGGRLTETGYDLIGLPYRKTGLEALSLYFECVSSDDAETIRRYVLAKYDERRMQWKTDFSSLSADDLALLKPVTRMAPLQAANSAGVSVTQDAINGAPETRDRSFGFCLRHPPVMLCGGSLAIARPYSNKAGLMPYALAIIKSIEFIDAPGDGARAASAVIPSPAVIPPK